MQTTGKTQREVQNYYGQVLKSSTDLKTNACCDLQAMPAYLKDEMSRIHPEILTRFYGCGSPLPQALRGIKALDLGCGTGRDTYLLSSLVGEDGQVVGIDMTAEQLEVAIRHRDWQMREFKYSRPNVEFHEGRIEDLKLCGIASDSLDLVVSNCVINLSTDKRKVFHEIFRVLKNGGELFFSDVFVDRRLPEDVKNDPEAYGECLGGALYNEDFRRILMECGCPDFRIVNTTPITVEDQRISALVGNARFYSLTIRAFKIESLEDRCEDYGQFATYLGTMHECPSGFKLDDHHHFEAHRPMAVCGNTAAMISETRYGSHFSVLGDRSRHFGLFDCAPKAGFSMEEDPSMTCC